MSERRTIVWSQRESHAQIVKDTGSGVSFRKKRHKAILESAIDGDKLEIMDAHRDRGCRFGFDLTQWAVDVSGGSIVVLKQTVLAPKQEFTQDLLTIRHVFSCRMHGLRNYKNKIAETFAHKDTKKNL